MPGGAGYVRFVQRLEGFAAERGALVDLQAIPRPYRAFRLDPGVGVGQAGRAVAGDFQDVFVAVGDQEAHGRALVFEDGVGGDGGAVKDVGEVFKPDAPGPEDFGQAAHEAHRGVFGRGRGFVDGLGAGVEFTEYDIGESAADIDGEGVARHGVSWGVRYDCCTRSGGSPWWAGGCGRTAPRRGTAGRPSAWWPALQGPGGEPTARAVPGPRPPC